MTLGPDASQHLEVWARESRLALLSIELSIQDAFDHGDSCYASNSCSQVYTFMPCLHRSRVVRVIANRCAHGRGRLVRSCALTIYTS